LEELDRDAHRQTEKQRAKVLQDLWNMDDHGLRPTKTPKKPVGISDHGLKPTKTPKKPVDLSDIKVDTRKNKSDNDSSWRELLDKKESKKRSSPQSDDSSKSSSVRNDELDLDLVPDRDWSARSSDEHRQRPHVDAKIEVDVVVESSTKRQQFKKKRQRTLERQASYAKDENPDYIRNLVNNRI
jgi:hypothetical protein